MNVQKLSDNSLSGLSKLIFFLKLKKSQTAEPLFRRKKAYQALLMFQALITIRPNGIKQRKDLLQ